MKIIQLTFALGSGGAERVVVDLSNELAARGCEVIVCAILDLEINPIFSFNLKNLDPRIKYVNLHQSEGFSISKLRTIEKFILSVNPDVVHCHLNNIPYIFRLALIKKDIKFVYTIHSIASKASGYSCQFFLNKFYFKRELIRPVTISKVCDDSYRKYYGLDNATCIYNGRSHLCKSPLFPKVKEELDSYKYNHLTQVFIHVARFYPEKNQKLLIEAFNELDKKGYNFILIVIGLYFDAESSKPLRDIACSKIHFYGSLDNIADYLFCSDAFCLTSLYEGLPISLLEAMSCGCVPICTAVGGIPDVIHDGKNGYLSKDLTVDSYVNTLIRYFDDNKICAQEIQDEFNSKYSIERTVDQYLDVYKKNSYVNKHKNDD